MPKIDMAFFSSVEGSMTSEDGQTFMLHVKRPTGGDLVGRAGAVSFPMPDDMPGQLSETLQKLANQL